MEIIQNQGDKNIPAYLNNLENKSPNIKKQIYMSDVKTSKLEKDKFDYSKDDGIISNADKARCFAKGLIAPVTDMFSSPENFIKGAGMIAGGAALLALTGGAAAPFLVAAGVAGGAVQFGVSAYRANQAKTDKEALDAWKGVGEGISIIGFSAAGAKASLKGANFETKGLNPLAATVECFKMSPKSIKNSIQISLSKFRKTPQTAPSIKTKVSKEDSHTIDDLDISSGYPYSFKTKFSQSASQTSSNTDSIIAGKIISEQKTKYPNVVEVEVEVPRSTAKSTVKADTKPEITAETAASAKSEIKSAAQVQPNEKIQNFIEKLKNNKNTKIAQKELTVNGQNIQFEIYEGTQAGSNTGYYALNKQTGELFYAKLGNLQSKTELLASKLYKMAGVKVPELTSFKSADGKSGILSKFIPDLTPVKSGNSAVNDGYGMDALLANWDSKCSNNTCLTADNKAVIVDCGGTFDFRAQGASKPFGAIPTEIITLIDSKVNYESAKIFGQLNRGDIIKSLEKAVNIKDADIISLLNDMKLSHYEKPLLQRKQFLKILLEKVKGSSQGNESTLSYMQKQMNAAIETSIEQAKTAEDLADISLSLDIIKDAKVKSSLQNKIAQKRNELIQNKPKATLLTDSDVTNLVVKNGFKQQTSGKYTFSVDNALMQQLESQYGSKYANKIKYLLETPLYSNDLQNIRTMLNAADGKYADFWQENFYSLIQTYQKVKETHIFKNIDEMGSGEWETLVNVAKNPPSEGVIAALDSYKSSSYEINTALTDFKKKGTSINSKVQTKIGCFIPPLP